MILNGYILVEKDFQLRSFYHFILCTRLINVGMDYRKRLVPKKTGTPPHKKKSNSLLESSLTEQTTFYNQFISFNVLTLYIFCKNEKKLFSLLPRFLLCAWLA